MLQHRRSKQNKISYLTLAALGVVYGDIGTSPLYALPQTLTGFNVNLFDILGVLSLVFWALMIVISLKYCLVLLRADNDGEGGILALLALLKGNKRNEKLLMFLAIVGAGLMLGDGMITPALSVMSAIEGLYVISPGLSDWVLPLTTFILIIFFSVQYLGTEKIGFIFGPVILIWFIVLAILGLKEIIRNPIALSAVNPRYAILYLINHGSAGYMHLGGVFLAVTGGEALYADMGHFGKKPIQLSWFCIVFPALLLNYFGQGAYLLNHPNAIANPFFHLAPSWFAFPLLILAMLATIIASQAVVSATFSLIRQAVLLGLYPHLPIIQTSSRRIGQIYVPQMNFILTLGTIFLVLTFQTSGALTHVYGIAVNLLMVLTTILVFALAVTTWRWPWYSVLIIFSFLFLVDISFLGSNAFKLITGGWIPVVFAGICAFIMYTWVSGREYIRRTYYMKKDTMAKTLKQLGYRDLHQLVGTSAVFITDIYDRSGGTFLNFLKLSRGVPEKVIILNYSVETVPHVLIEKRYEFKMMKSNICLLTLHYGFMDTISIPKALDYANKTKILPFKINIDQVTYFIEIPHVVASIHKRTLLFYWQEKLFAFLVRNYSTNLNIEFYHLPFTKTIALGTYYVI